MRWIAILNSLYFLQGLALAVGVNALKPKADSVANRNPPLVTVEPSIVR